MNGNGKTEINSPDTGAMPEMPEMPGMEMFFNKHFMRVDGRSRIVGFFSDAFDIPTPREGETDVLINDKGGRHVQLILDGELTHENPVEMMRNEQNIPLLKWDSKDGKIVRRAENEIRADTDALPAPEPSVPVEERLKHLEKAAEYHDKAIEIIMGTLPKPQQAQVAQFQKAMTGGMLDG